MKNGPGDPDVSASPAPSALVPAGIDPADMTYPSKAPASPVLAVNNMNEYPVFEFDSGALKDGVRFESPVPGSDVRGICLHFTNTSQVRKGQEIVFYINGTEAGRYSRDSGSQYADLTSARSAVAAGENMLTASLPSGTKFRAELTVYSDALAVNASLEISAKTGTVVPEALYGMNMEITRSCWYGGLSAQLLNNRKFFALRQGDVPEGWTVSGGRTVTDDRDHSICGSNYVVLEKGGQLVYSDILALDKGTEYELELWTAAREGSGSVSVYIGEEKIGEFGSGTEAEAHKLSFRAMAEGGSGALSVRCDGGCVEVFEASILPAANFHGMNIDAVAALKALGPVTLRYPGGCCADRFDWKESIKPAAYRRPMEADEPGYTGMSSFLYTSTYDQDPLDLGLEEFFCLCEEVGAKAELTVSLVRGNEKDAAELVRYCKDNSHDVSAWFIGNEIYFFGGSLASDPVLAADVTDKFITAMRNEQSDIRVVVGACDNAPEFVRWTGSYFGKLAELGTKYDFVSVHNYYGQVVDFTDRYKAGEFLKTTCAGFVSSPLPVIKSMAGVLNNAGVLNTADPEIIDGAGLYLDEWNWGFSMAPSTMMFLGDSAYLLSMLRTVAEYPLTAASFFHPFEGMIVSSGSSRELSGSGYAYKLLKAHIGGNIAESRLSAGPDNVSVLTTVADNKLVVSVVNLGNESLLLDLSAVRAQGFNGEVSVKVICANTLSLKDEATLSAGNIELYSSAAAAADPSDATAADSPLSVLIPGCALVQITAG
ncbi:MAG: hypothetical protein J5950_00565 [Clostridia bacterium]|nr:hypothetical protein [Clostridia bacterium]